MESSRNEEIIYTVEKMIKLLIENNEQQWSFVLQNILSEYCSGKDKEASALLFIKTMRGGMGSFLDLVLHKDRKPLTKESDELDDLREKMYHLIVEQHPNLRGK